MKQKIKVIFECFLGILLLSGVIAGLIIVVGIAFSLPNIIAWLIG